jgi:peptidyl-prolyl cis-trans isomerase SurA
VELQKERMTEKLTRTNLQGPLAAIVVLAVAAVAMPSTYAQTQQPNYQVPSGTFTPGAGQFQLPPLPSPAPITPNGSVVEDVVARINDQVITRSEFEKARDQMVQEAQQQNTPQSELDDHLRNLLRDMIDQQLLLSKGKELGITGDADTMRQLDDIRKSNHLDSMEALQKAAEQQGVSFEDFKQRIRDQVISQQVVRDEVGRHLNLTHAQEEAYYTAHAKDFQVPEQVHLSEILIPTPENATDAQITAAQAKADDVAAKIKAGGNFADTAKTASGGPTASAGGDLGDFKRGTLGTVLENATFGLPEGGVTAPIRTRQGFVILRVDSHQAAGVPPLEQVEGQVEQAIYLDALQPALRAYLTKSRQDAYVEIAKGFVDTGAPHSKATTSQLAYTAYKAPAIKKHTLKKQRLEQDKAVQAQAVLAAARERVAEKQATKAADEARKSGVKNVNGPVKRKKIRREKIRYGEAPRNALPPAPAGASTDIGASGAPIQGEAPGVAMSPTESVTSITTGVGAEPDSEEASAPEAPHKKTRYTSRESEAAEQHDQAKLASAEAKAQTRPVVAPPQQDATEKHQAAPLGLNGDTEAKKKKPKRKKGEALQRLQEKPKPTAPEPPAPTVNPNVIATPGGLVQPANTTPAPPKSSDQTTLPPTTAGAPGAQPQGQPTTTTPPQP